MFHKLSNTKHMNSTLHEALRLALNRTLHNSNCSKVRFQRSRQYRPGGGEDSCSCGADHAKATIQKALDEMNEQHRKAAASSTPYTVTTDQILELSGYVSNQVQNLTGLPVTESEDAHLAIQIGHWLTNLGVKVVDSE